ncbi:BspA family leucine-rich repeat surface protein [Arcobacter cryaerophilus gv. pseudocryaerophilus]|nr:BspA family leucine-rich repeat surface protein [Arcobacter sp. AZ-2023]WNP38017.1 BspA family leucine-rich repeat surface protein [Arcobacter sp. AZ-2023]WNP40109.1 BspA family leucine-rich repeat surface protein [Arcobacter sp. AZ-2023]WPD07601.1 BspA family leucine-rich repeat surface protein [Arcobacter sp. DSM 115955]
MNFILPIIAGIIMMATLGASIGPSFVEQMKIKKVENRTISNQNLIKDAIVRYIKLEKKVPKDLEELKASGLLKDQHETNLFDGGYSFNIDKKKGTLKIFTTINDEDAGKYFSNSFKFPNAPTCIEFGQNGACTGKFETFYLLDEDTFKSIPIPEVGSIEDIQDRFTKVEEVGKKFDEATLVGGEKDYIVDLVTKEVTEYTYDKGNDKWVENPTKIVVPTLNSSEHGIEIKDIEVRQLGIDENNNYIVNYEQYEKVICKYEKKNSSLSDLNYYAKDFFVINQNTGLGEIIWVAKQEDVPGYNLRQKIFNGTSNVFFKPNNICITNLNQLEKLFDAHYTNVTTQSGFEKKFNSPLNRWDTSNITNMSRLFLGNITFNQDISSWDVSKVENMDRIFFNTPLLNQDLSKWCIKGSATVYAFNSLGSWEESKKPQYGKCPIP